MRGGTSIGEWRQRALQFLQSDVWNAEAMARSGMRRLQGVLQLGAGVGEALARDMVLLRASGLTYYTVLAVVPLLAFALSIMQALGVNQSFMPRLVEQLTQVSPQAAAWILSAVERIDFAQLGTIGAAVLFLTTLLGLASIERAFNQIWGIAHARSIHRRITDYLAVLVIAPLLIGVAFSIATTLQSQILVRELLETPGVSTVYHTGLRWAPPVLLGLGFAFLYWFMPNTRVRPAAALLGGIVAGVLFGALQYLYVRFNVGVARSNAIYGGLAALPLFVGWVYLSWVIVLLGAEVAAVWQNLAELRRARRATEPSPAAREVLGLAIAVRLARNFDRGAPPLSAETLAQELRLPVRSAREILCALEGAGIASRAGVAEREELFQLGRAADRIGFLALLEALRGRREGAVPPGEPATAALAQTLAEMDRRCAEAVGNLSLADLARVHERDAV